LAYLLHRTDPQTAQDVLQEVFVTVFRKADDGDREVLTLTGWYDLTPRQAAEALGPRQLAEALRG